MIQSKMNELEGSQHFSHYKSMRIFPDRAANSAVLGPIWPNFELIPDVMDVLVTCKNKEDPIKSGHKIFPIITLWELSVAMETRVLIRSGPKLIAVFPPSQ